MIQLLYVLHSAKLLKATFEKEIEQGLALIAQEHKNIHKLAKEIAGKLLNHHIAIYTTVGYEGLAVRCRQQLNENSKVLAWHNVIPEMTHNEIVGWKQAHPEVIPVYCYSKSDFDKNLKRLQYLKKVVKKFTPHSVDILIKGDNYWQKTLYFINLTDWISVYLSDLNGNDAIEVKVIDGLKKEMSKK
jgi:glucose/mannose-6-phosphate isomerase